MAEENQTADSPDKSTGATGCLGQVMALGGDFLGAVVLILLAFFFLGARMGEVFRLRWEDVDFLAHRVRLGTRKTRNGDMRYDWVPMPETLPQRQSQRWSS